MLKMRCREFGLGVIGDSDVMLCALAFIALIGDSGVPNVMLNADA